MIITGSVDLLYTCGPLKVMRSDKDKYTEEELAAIVDEANQWTLWTRENGFTPVEITVGQLRQAISEAEK